MTKASLYEVSDKVVGHFAFGRISENEMYAELLQILVDAGPEVKRGDIDFPCYDLFLEAIATQNFKLANIYPYIRLLKKLGV